MKLKLSQTHLAVFLSVYALTLVSTDEEKEASYSNLIDAISAVPFKHQLFVLGGFNARDFSTWPKVIGHHSVGRENSNGTLLLQTCAQHELVITNTLFQ